MIEKRAQLALIFCLGLTGCADVEVEEAKPRVTEQKDRIREQYGTIHGNRKGFVLYSTREDAANEDENGATSQNDTRQAAIPRGSVNAYLWQASLESLDFMPLAQADSRGGVIITDWYAPSESPEERFKVNVYIQDAELRADVLKVTVFRQVDSGQGWVDAPVDDGTATGLEDNILKRARELRLTQEGNQSAS